MLVIVHGLPAETLARLDLFQDKVVVKQKDAVSADDCWSVNRTIVKPAADRGNGDSERICNFLLAMQVLLLLVFGHIATHRGLLNRAAYKVHQLLACHVDNALVEELFDDIFVIELNHGRKITKGQNSV